MHCFIIIFLKQLEKKSNHISCQVLPAPAGITAGGSHGNRIPGIIKVGKEEVFPVLLIARDTQGPELLPDSPSESP